MHAHARIATGRELMEPAARLPARPPDAWTPLRHPVGTRPDMHPPFAVTHGTKITRAERAIGPP
jgi:hypothetical protein